MPPHIPFPGGSEGHIYAFASTEALLLINFIRGTNEGQWMHSKEWNSSTPFVNYGCVIIARQENYGTILWKLAL